MAQKEVNALIKQAAAALKQTEEFVKKYRAALTAFAGAVDAHNLDTIKGEELRSQVMPLWKKLDDTGGEWLKLERMTQFSDQMLSAINATDRAAESGAVVRNAAGRRKK